VHVAGDIAFTDEVHARWDQAGAAGDFVQEVPVGLCKKPEGLFRVSRLTIGTPPGPSGDHRPVTPRLTPELYLANSLR
jgi:hypothetical protein